MRELKGRITLVGAGQMGGAMLKGWLKAGLSPSQIQVLDPSPSDAMRELITMQAISLNETLHAPEVLILAVKPQLAASVLEKIAPLIAPNTLILSIMAGKTIAGLQAYFSPNQPVIRTIPNTPASVGRGITAAFASASVSLAQKTLGETLLASLGQVVWVEEEANIDAATAVSGSGPAYVFHMVEALAKAGEAQGLPTTLSLALARATVEGAGELLWQNQAVHPATLRENVTSPNGTTFAALQVLMPALTPLMTNAVEAATKRSQELAS